MTKQSQGLLRFARNDSLWDVYLFRAFTIVPTIVLAEALDIAEKGRVEFEFNRMYRLIVEEPEFEIVGFGFEIFEETMKIKGVKEIHDRIIVASAKFYQVGVLTKDRIINDSGEVETL